MAKLIGLGLENFRVFSEYTEFDFAPITLLTGANNSGKSSLIKALLLLADNTGRRKNLLEELNFSGELTDVHNLGSFELALNNSIEKDKTISFSAIILEVYDYEKFKITFTYSSASTLQQIVVYEFNEKTHEYNDFFSITLKYINNKYKYCVNYSAAYLVEKVNKPANTFFRVDSENMNRPICVEENHLTFLKEKINHQINDVLLIESFFLDLNNLMWEWYSSFFIQQEKGVSLNFLYNIKGKNNDLKKDLLEKNPKYAAIIAVLNESFPQINHFKREYFEKLDYQLSNIESKIDTYLKEFDFEFETAVRANSKRFYTIVSQGTSFNQLLVKFNKMNFTENSKEKNFINKWINLFEIANLVKFEWREAVGTEIKLFRNGKELDLADLGFGVTQLLPLLMRIVICKTEYLILEEPENSLHPNLQSKLADMLIDAHRTFGINFIVETHSEYLIRKLQYLRAKQEISVNDTAIYYFNNPENIPQGKKQVERIRIQEDGRLDKEFGVGFFDHSIDLMMSTFKFKNGKK